MSDYVYMLESRLSPDQNRALREIQAAAVEGGVTLFLTGGAMRDMLAGFRIRDLDFVVEGAALKLVKGLADAGKAVLASSDETRKSAELVFPGGVTAQLATARREQRGRAGSRQQAASATIQEDLRGRDFTCNAIALSLGKASRGLLLDPMNGLADIERRELRAVSPYVFYDDPSRLLRLIRFQIRLGFTVEERTQTQVANAREAKVEESIPAPALGDELRRIAGEDAPCEIVRVLGEAGLLALYSPALAGPKLNMAGLARLEQAFPVVPEEPRWRAARLAPFLYALAEKLSTRERQALAKAADLTKGETDFWSKLETRASKLEAALRSARARKASQVYHIVQPGAPEEILFLLSNSGSKPVQERLRAYFQQYLPAVEEITPEEWGAIEGKPGAPRYNKAREALIAERLDRPAKPPDEITPETAPLLAEPARRGK